MEGFEWIERMPKFLRWILFMPSFFITLILGILITKFSLHFLGPEDQSIFAYLINRFSIDLGAAMLSILVSCLMIPRGKLILAAVYLGLIILFIGFILATIVMYGLVEPLWKVVYELSLLLSAGLLALLSTKENAERVRDQL